MKPHFLTLGQAVKHVQCSKATLSKALNKGDLSGSKQDDGSWRIDPSELTRWDSERSTRGQKITIQTPVETPINPPENSALQIEVATLKAKLAMIEESTERERAQLVDQVEDLKARLDAEQAERRAATERLLAAPEKAAQARKGLFGWFGASNA